MKKKVFFMISLLCAVAQGMQAQSAQYHNIYYYELNNSYQYVQRENVVSVLEGEGYTLPDYLTTAPPSDRIFKGWVAVTGAPDANDDGLLQDGETLVLPGTTLSMGTTNLYYKARYTNKLVLSDGDILTGTQVNNVQISIADGATVTLRNVTINGENNLSYPWAGLTCNGNATIILEGTNSVTGFLTANPGILVKPGYTLTIQGDGSLYASSHAEGAGIGNCGTEINDGSHDCGNIVIKGGTIVAEGRGYSAGIGAGRDALSGNITITSGVKSVIVKRGSDNSSRCIGGKAGSGTVTIGGVEYFDGNNYQNDGAKYIGKDVFAYVKGNEGETGQYWTTFYYEGSNLQASEGTQVFKAGLSGTTLTLYPISDRIINSGQGAILKSNSDHFLLATSTSASSDNYTGNDLTGTMTAMTNPDSGKVYVLNYKSGEGKGVGFYKLSSEGTIGANKAYLVVSTSTTNAREYFLFDETTGIKAIDNGQLTIDNEVYDLQGRRVQNPTRGLYIVNGKKVVIK